MQPVAQSVYRVHYLGSIHRITILKDSVSNNYNGTVKVFVGHLLPDPVSLHVFERAGPLSTNACINEFYVHVTVHRKKFIFNNTNRLTNFPNLFCQETLHVSGISSAHHQGFSTVHSALVYVMQVWWF